jgi:SAM-dependent methyltransferase
MASLSSHYPFHLTPGGPALTRRLISLAAPAAPVSSALLVGCRYGENVFAASEALGCPVIGIEEDSESIFYAKMAALSAKDARASFRFMAPVTLDFADGSFDVVICEGVLAAYPHTKALAEAVRVLRSGGTLALADSCWLDGDVPTFVRDVWEDRSHKILHRDALTAAVESAGITDLRVVDASKKLAAFYKQFGEEVRTIVSGGFEGMKHHKSLVKHYKHEIDVYARNGGSRWMGYLLVAGRKA